MNIGQSMESAQKGGKYDKECAAAYESIKSGPETCAVLIVVDGDRGHGFSAIMNHKMAMKMPLILRACADDIEAEIKKSTAN